MQTHSSFLLVQHKQSIMCVMTRDTKRDMKFSVTSRQQTREKTSFILLGVYFIISYESCHIIIYKYTQLSITIVLTRHR